MAPLTRGDWIEAALVVLEEDGPGAVGMEQVARHLGITKGSAYHHFGGRDDLLRAALQAWDRVHTRELFAEMEGLTDPRERITQLFLQTASKPQTVWAKLVAAADDAVVGEIVRTVAQARVDFVERALRDLGLTRAAAHRRALVAYATHLGLAQLTVELPNELADASARRRFAREALELLLP